MKLIALKSIGRMRPGDEFEVNGTQARVLKALGKAADAPVAMPVADEREVLRSQAQQLGVEVDGRWGADRIRQEIASSSPAPGPDRLAPRYQRRDMRADEE